MTQAPPDQHDGPKVVLIPTAARPTFAVDVARKLADSARDLLVELGAQVVGPSDLVMAPEDVEAAKAYLATDADLVINVCASFSDASPAQKPLLRPRAARAPVVVPRAGSARRPAVAELHVRSQPLRPRPRRPRLPDAGLPLRQPRRAQHPRDPRGGAGGKPARDGRRAYRVPAASRPHRCPERSHLPARTAAGPGWRRTSRVHPEPVRRGPARPPLRHHGGAGRRRHDVRRRRGRDRGRSRVGVRRSPRRPAHPRRGGCLTGADVGTHHDGNAGVGATRSRCPVWRFVAGPSFRPSSAPVPARRCPEWPTREHQPLASATCTAP